jgi:cysteinyl-tRNA synthetase
MITINGKKMGKSYNNQIMLTQLFAGTHPLLEQPYTPMTIRFFILQTHYRSTLDFSNEALQASEKGMKRLWEAYQRLQTFNCTPQANETDKELAAKCEKLVSEFDEFMNDDFSTAKVIANMFELVPVINSIKDGHIKPESLGERVLTQMQKQFRVYLENIFGLKGESEKEDGKLNGVLELLIEIRKEARARKDYATSDKIRNQLQELGILMKDEKDGGVSISFG